MCIILSSTDALATLGFTHITSNFHSTLPMFVSVNTDLWQMFHTPFCIILNYIYTNFRTPNINDSLLSVTIVKVSRIICMQPTKMPGQKLHTAGIPFFRRSLSAACSSDKVATSEFRTASMIMTV